jgi:Mg-chelatase subunit ChlD
MCAWRRASSAGGSFRRPSVRLSGLRLAIIVLGTIVAAGHTGAGITAGQLPPGAMPAAIHQSAPTPTPDVFDTPRLDAACRALAPYYTAARYRGDATDGSPVRAAAALVAFAAPLDAGGAPYTHSLATVAQVGAVYGLAYDAPRHQLYAAAYLKRMAWFGPGGPGQIYRMDFNTGRVTQWARLPAGTDHHSGAQDLDAGATLHVGRSSLGDIELDDAGTTLFVSNMEDAHIWRIAVPDGTVLGSFPLGAAGESWAAQGRLFGLGFHDGWLYHGVIDLTGASLGVTGAVGHIYRSRADGSEMRDVARFALEPDTGSWVPDGAGLSDIEFTPDGDLIVGLRNRAVDTNPRWTGRAGDLLPSVREGDEWRVITAPDQFRDRRADIGSLSLGGLAAVPGFNRVVSVAGDPGGTYYREDVAFFDPGRAFAWWFDRPSGEPLMEVDLGALKGPLRSQPPTVGLGDVEVLCPRDARPDPSHALTATEQVRSRQTATATPPAPPPTQSQGHGSGTSELPVTLTAWASARPATGTARPTHAAGTATALAATASAATPTPSGVPVGVAPTLTAIAVTLTAQAPTRAVWATAAAAGATAPPTVVARYARIVAACDTDNPYIAGVHLLPVLGEHLETIPSSMRAAESAIFAVRDGPGLFPDSDLFALATQGAVGATYGLAWDWRRGHLYASAYHSRATTFGAGGPGGIYRLDLTSGAASRWTWLDAGSDTHDLERDYDERAVAGVGQRGLGDLEIDEAGTTLFAVNLYDRMIYRLSLPDGRVLGAFPHGAAGATWASDARPFGLGVRGDWLYHGVIDGRGSRGGIGGTAYVYRSRADGSATTEVARFDLSYPRSPDWWAWGTTAWLGGRVPTGAMLTDIVFGRSGDMVVGLRDRFIDGTIFGGGTGDMLRAMPFGPRFVAATEPGHFDERYDVSWGGLAVLPRQDVTVSTRDTGLTWYGNPTGDVVWNVDFTVPSRKWSALGDIEVLCPPAVAPPSPTETATPMPTPTDSPTPTPTGTPTRTASRTLTPSPMATEKPTPTPTSVPGRIYLPIAVRHACTPQSVYADVVLVIDVSTSMRRATADGREKLAAVQSAASLFLDQMDFRPDGRGDLDQVALVGFNSQGWIEQPLTSDTTALRAGIDHLRAGMHEGTRLDLAIDWGVRALDGPERRPANTPVIVLMTDGLPNGVPPGPGGTEEETVFARAAAAKSRGIRLYAIGVGLPDGADVADRINMDLLRAVASEPRMAFQTFSAEELARIYGEIAYTLGCPSGAYWPA